MQTMFTEFDNQARGGLQAKLTKKERAAISTIMFGVPEAVRDKFVQYVETKGMIKKSAFSLEALSADVWRRGWTSKSFTEKWADLLTTTDESIAWVQSRMIIDNDSLPDLMRKPLPLVEVEQLFLIANLLSNSLTNAATDLPSEVHRNLRSHCSDKFFAGALDSTLGDYVTARPESFIWDNLPFISSFRQFGK